MMDELTRISQLHLQGFHCAQVLLIMGLEQQGKEDPDLIRAMNGLSGGLGFQGLNVVNGHAPRIAFGLFERVKQAIFFGQID